MVNLFPDFRKKERLSLSNHGKPLILRTLIFYCYFFIRRILLLEVLSSGCAKLLKSDQFHGLNAQTFFLVQKTVKSRFFKASLAPVSAPDGTTQNGFCETEADCLSALGSGRRTMHCVPRTDNPPTAAG